MNSITKKITLSAGLGLLLLTSGCFDTKEDFTLNPDGSGKVIHECTFQALNLNADNAGQDAGKALTNAVREVLEQAKGVDAWRDVTFKTLDDGRIYFRGTAYFKDLSKLDIPNQTMLELAWTRTADGNALITLRTNKSDEAEGMGIHRVKKTPPKNLTPEALDKLIKQQRGQYQQARPMIAGILGPMKHDIVLHLPGKVLSHSNFTNDANGNLAISFSGARMLEVMDKLVNDDAWCRAHSGTDFDDMQEKPVMDAELNQFIFGEKAPVQAVVAPGTAPLFNYAVEVAAAKTEYAQAKKALRIGSPMSSSDDAEEVTAAPATGGLKSVKVAGIRLVRESDQHPELRAFNWDAGYSVSLLVEFPGAVQSVTDETALEVATADDGTSLLPDSDWNRKVHFPSLAKDKTAAILEFKLNLPGSGVNGLKELSGQVQYRVSGGTKEIDLGFDGLKEGATGTNLDAEIKSIKEGWQKNGSQEMSLHLRINPDGIKSLSLVADGVRTVLSQRGYGGGNGTYDFNYECQTNFPENGRLVAEVYDKMQTFEVPFKLENLTLLGTDAEAKK